MNSAIYFQLYIGGRDNEFGLLSEVVEVHSKSVLATVLFILMLINDKLSKSASCEK